MVKDLCRHTNIPISDIDIEVSNEEPLDSILIQVDNPLFSHALQIPVGNYNLAQGLNFWNKIYNNGITTNKEFTEAIRNAVFINDGPRDSREIVISITPYYNGVAGKIARAFIKITDPLPDSGEDRLISGCVSDSLLYLKSLNPRLMLQICIYGEIPLSIYLALRSHLMTLFICNSKWNVLRYGKIHIYRL